METPSLPLHQRLGGLPPHSLGKPIEWKLHFCVSSQCCDKNLPTRWGNQLNGNSRIATATAALAALPTRWGNQLNGNCTSNQYCSASLSPHSLGKPIEWKPKIDPAVPVRISLSPHSLGKPIEWKLCARARYFLALSTPHSLGKPIEWKPQRAIKFSTSGCSSPHSLGKPIEWKQFVRSLVRLAIHLPTRWGNQLNGNYKNR